MGMDNDKFLELWNKWSEEERIIFRLLQRSYRELSIKHVGIRRDIEEYLKEKYNYSIEDNE